MEDNEKNNKSTKRDPEGVRRDILETASAVFAESGLAGARIDEITARTKTSKRMIYYYFGDKEGLYKACLEAAYARVRQGEKDLDLSVLSPPDALAQLVSFTFDHHRRNPDFIRMVMIENIHHAEFLNVSEVIKGLNKNAIARLQGVIDRGQASGEFRDGIDATELHWQISALSFFNMSNRPTFGSLFGSALFSDEGQERLRARLISMILNDTLKG